MTGFKVLTLMVLGGVLLFLNRDKSSGQAPVKPERDVSTATYACKEWTRQSSKLAVTEIIGEGEIPGAQLKDYYHISLTYRGGTAGLLMRSECEVMKRDERFVVVGGKSGPLKG